MEFRAEIESNGKTATGIVVPDEVVESLGKGKRPPVRITLNGYTYRTTVAFMGGRFLVPVAAAVRAAAGVKAGDVLDVGIENDDEPRTVEVPEDLAAALATDDAARAFFDTLSFTHRKEWARWVEETKRPETRATRVQKTVEGLRAGKRTH